ncbi:MAG TPA: M23 family metallopeptidase [Acidimicrobiales bacterium]|nr:M23 family metallopeptidase [Acidimicrobiales bacterium]
MTLGIGSDARPTRSVELGSVPIAAASVGLAPPPPVADVSDWGLGAFRAQEAAEQAALRRDGIVAASRSAERPSLGWPAAGPLSGWYGERRGRRGHVGVDVDGDTGDPIVAAGAGVVEWAGPAPDGYSGYGLMVLIRHSDAVTTLYAHLSRIAVRAGEVVDRGDYIGAMGTTGNVTGSHLHFEVRLGGTPVNPRDWLPSR